MTPLIPNVYQFVFGLREQTEPFHLMHYVCLRSCLEVMRPDAVRFHYRNEPFGPLWDEIRPQLDLVPIEPVTPADGYAYADAGIAAYRYAHMSDFVRLEILLREGGIYADMDTLFLHPLPAQLRHHACVMGRETSPLTAAGEGSLCNALIGAAPRSGFCQMWLDRIWDAFDGTWSNHSTLLPHRLSLSHPELIHVEPSTSFFALDWTPDGLADLFLRSRALGEDCYSLHLWSHLWFEPTRRDFCTFNGELLTEDYLAFAAATYAEHARRFLPAAARPSRLRYLMQSAELHRHQLLHGGRRAAGALRRRLRSGGTRSA